MKTPSQPSTMESTSPESNRDLSAEIEAFLTHIRSVQIASINAQQQAHISYTPFILEQNSLYIVISELALHTQNLRQQARCSLLFIEDEQQCHNIFARRRLTLTCKASFLATQHPRRDDLFTHFEQRHGGIVQQLKQLADFSIVALSPTNGRYIKGFGQAWQFDGFDLSRLRHVKGK